jgi:hypothetical protein
VQETVLLEIAQISITTSLMKVNSIIYIFQALFQYIKQSQSVMSHQLKRYLRVVVNFVTLCSAVTIALARALTIFKLNTKVQASPTQLIQTFTLIFYPSPLLL